MYVLMKMTIMLVLMGSGMEIQKQDALGVPCVFHYEQAVGPLTQDLPEEQRAIIKVMARDMEGKACSDVAIWASTVMDGLEAAKIYDEEIK